MMSSSPSPSARSSQIAVSLVEDDPHFRLFVSSLLEASPRHRLAATAESAAEMQAWPADNDAAVVLVDSQLPDARGADVVAEIVQRYPQVLCVMLSGLTDEQTVLDAIRVGAVGYVVKGASADDILAAINDALAGGAPMTPGIARKVLGMMKNSPLTTQPRDGAVEVELSYLTPRELQVLELVADGATDKEVSTKLSIATSTVKNTLLAVYAKWRVRSRTEAAVKFVRVKSRREYER
jgi:DNA-binding NarL/FixJ family response regulator